MLFLLIRAAVLLTATLGLAASSGAIGITDLRCEHRHAPHGIDTPAPRLSWALTSQRRGDRQTAYEVQVATTPEKLAEGAPDVWQSGKIDSDASHLVEYAGRKLASHERLWWRVRVWDGGSEVSEWSEPSDWIMGLLDPAEWRAEWIGLEVPKVKATVEGTSWVWSDEGNAAESAPPGKRYFRYTFDTPSEKVIDAVLRITADNRVDIYLNGRKLGSRSGWQSTKELDLTNLVQPGRNVLAACATNEGDGPNPAGLVAWLRAKYAGGRKLVVGTGDKVKFAVEAQPGWSESDFDDSDWKPVRVLGPVGMAPWGPVQHAESRELPARHLRHEFELPSPVKRATVSWCGLGLSELFVNGERVGDQVMSPAMSQYPERAYYLTRDVTKLVRTGANALGVTLGNGRFYSPRSEVYAGMPSYGSPMLRLRLTIEHEDGSTTAVVSDEGWRMTDAGPIRANNEYDGETYAARRELGDWSRVGYDDSTWRKAPSLASPSKSLRAEPLDPMRVTQTIRAIAVNELRPGVYVYDLGQNLVGWCRLRVRGPAGTTVTLRHAERLTDEGELYVANLRGAKATDRYTLRGGEEETWTPRFTLHGFRYIEVTGYPGTPALDAIEGCVVHDDVDSVGEFVCSNEVVNRVYQNARWGVRGNYRSVPLDCPQRDERQGWLGDRLDICRGESYYFNVAPLYAKWLGDIRDSQKANGSLPDVAPIHWPLFTDNVVWPSAAVLVPGMHYDQYGDLRAVAEQYSSNARWIAYMRQYVRPDGLIPRDSYGDWCVPPESPELIHSKDPARITDTTFLASLFFSYDLKQMERYAMLLGKDDEAADYAREADAMREAVNKAYYKADLGQYSNGTQTSSVLPLAFGIVPEGEAGKLAATLQRHVAERDGGAIATGLVGGQYLCRTLTDIGRPDLALGIASREAYPSWGYMAKEGATTIWELWNGDTADPAMNSGNHVMLIGDFVTWLYEDLAGIAPDPSSPGFKRIVMRPQTPVGLDFARASLKSPRGRIASEWRRSGSSLVWCVAIPPGATAELHLPTGDAANVNEDGKTLSEAEGVGKARFMDGRVVVEVGSGEYEFTVRR